MPEQNIPEMARRAVRTYIQVNMLDVPDLGDIYAVWACKILQNWKAMVSTTTPDDMYYEVTYNGDKDEVYVDAYRKEKSVVYSAALMFPEIPKYLT